MADIGKEEILSRKRRLILNNDGGDATLQKSASGKPEDFLNTRTAPLIDSHVDCVSYCTSRGFGTFIHDTKIGNLETVEAGRSSGNAVESLIKKGTDPLRVMTEYLHAHGKEILWSMRMNDTHDATRIERFEGNKFKMEHGDCLLGSRDKPPAHGAWSAVDYGCDKVRSAALSFFEEVCANYDVDGVEFDFFRHPVFFRQTSEGKPVTDKERGQMTALIRAVSGMLRIKGEERGRPFITAMRSPDDAGYCSTIGLEIEKWMKEGLIDIYIPSGYFRLNSWEYSVRLGQEYGVKVYPCLSESRIGGKHHGDSLRSSDEGYRARAMSAWSAGADGIYIFNLFDPRRKIWDELGEPEKLAKLNKIYFPSFMGKGRAAGGAYPHEHFTNIPVLNPDSPVCIGPGERKVFKIDVGEDIINGAGAGGAPAVKLFLRLHPAGIMEEAVIITALNGKELCGRANENWIEFGLEAGDIRKGGNTVEVYYLGGRRDSIEVMDLRMDVNYSGSYVFDDSHVQRTRDMM